ncbi:MAG: T9SS type A sorting domain-containing protein [Bacteroidota bacterium]
MNCGGINGPVSFKLAPGTYNEQVSVNAVLGASATNRITFTADSAHRTIITYAASINTQAHTFRLNNAPFVTLRNLTIETTGSSYGVAVHVMGNSNSTRIKSCILKVAGSGVTSTSNYFMPVLVNNFDNVTNPTSGIGSQLSGLEIDSNIVLNGYYGMMVYGSYNSPYANGVSIRNNRIDSSYYYGVNINYLDGINFNYNVVNMRVSGSVNSYGVAIQNGYFATGTNVFTITNNRVINAGQYGFYIYQNYNGNSTYRSKFINNMSGGGFRFNQATAIYCRYLNYWDIWNNTANLDFPTTQSQYAAMYLSDGSVQDIRNNMLVNSATSGSGIPFYGGSSTVISALNYNNYFNNAGSGLLTVGGPLFTASDFINGGGFNQNSKNQNPGFASATDLHLGSGCINGTTIAGITTDFEGNVRNNPPDIGADEFIGSLSNDIGVAFINSPRSPFSPGLQDVVLRINNYGVNAITAVNVNYSVNGGTVRTVAWTGNLAPCDTTSVVFTGANQFNFALGGSYAVKAFTSLPNGVTDANPSNDTLNSTSCPSLNGAYTINPAGSGSTNFTTFTAAANSLSCGGISGPVTFTVSPGTYTEQFTIGSIIGASATNRVEFRPASNNASDVILTFNAAAPATNYIANIAGADYVKFAKITFTATNVNYGVAVALGGSSDYNTFDSCAFNGISTTNGSQNLSLVFVNGSKDNYNVFTNNTFNNAAYGIYWYSNTSQYAVGNQFNKNTFNNQYAGAIYAYYLDFVKIKENVINSNTSYTNYYGINAGVIYSNSGMPDVSKNRVFGVCGGGAGLYMYNSQTTSSRFLVSNNMVNLSNSTNSILYGIQTTYCNSIDILHNTVNIVSIPSGQSYAYRNTYFFNTLSIIQNNVFVNNTPGGANAFAVSHDQPNNAATWNNNNYYSSGTNLGQWGTTGYPTLAGWRTASSNQDLNSYNLRPQFVSATNLAFNNLPCLNNGGANVLAKVPDDLAGVARTITPDVGALEFTSDSLDASAEVIHSPSGAVNIGNSYDVAVRVRNAGANVITSLNVSYRVNGGTPVTRSFTGLTLNPCDTMKVVFDATSGPGSSDQRYVASGGLNDIKAFTSLPNTRADLNNTNDTTSVILCTPFAGSFSINGAQPLSATNFPSFTSAINALNGCGGITGPVTFNVAAGTYTEQVDLSAITGVSAVNTLTFDGGAGNAASRVLTFGGATNTARHTLKFNKARYVTVKNITIQTTGGSYGWAVHLFDSSYNNTISNCIIDVAGGGMSNTSQNFSGIVASGSTTSPTTGLRIDSLRIDSNTINGGYYGIVLYGASSANQSQGTVVRNNKITNSYYYGTYLYFQNAFKLNRNKVSMRTGVNASQNSTGMYVSDCIATGSAFHEFLGNTVVDATNVGIQLQNTSTASVAIRSKFWNNMISGGFTYQYGFGLSLSSSSNWDIFHNSINHDATTTNQLYSAVYVTGGNGNAVKNNIFAATGNGSSGLAFYANSTASFINTAAFNYNMFYKLGNTPASALIYFQGTQSNTSTIGAFGSNLNSFVQNPNFLGARNLHVKDGCFNGDSLGVIIDIDGNTRASFADIGADEVPSDSNDIGVQFMLKPGVPIASGTQDVQVIIKNFGAKEVIGGTVSYSVNNGTPVTINFTDTIAPCDTALITFTGAQQYNFVLGSSYELKIFTSQPNGQPDLYTANDTFSTGNICLGMAGNYTINPAGSGTGNYTSFGAAITALQCGGVAGTVTFDVAAATYNEQVNIPYIPGVSAANRIIFNGGAGNKASRILTFAASTQNDAHTVRFNNTSFIEFHNMTIRGTGVSYAWPVHIMGITNSVKVRNSTIEITTPPASNTSFIPVVMNGAFNTPYAQAKQDSVEIDSNTIINGYASIWAYNATGVSVKVRNNVLNNPYYYGMYFQQAYASIIQNNTINMLPGGDITSQGIYLVNSNSSGALYNEVSGNKIFDMGQYGIYTASSSGTFAARSLMFNNVITGFRNNSSHAGLQIDNSNYWGIYFNTVNSDIATSGVSGALSFTNGNQNDVRNNIFAVTAASSSMLALSSPSAVSTTTLDYNNYYKVGNTNSLVTIGTTTYGASNFIGAGGFNSNSFSRDPLFTSGRNLHVGNGCNNGVVIAAVTKDMDGDTRVSPPDVGADEVTTGVNDNIGVVSVISPVTPLTAGSQAIKMIIANLGNNEVTSATISYSVNGGTPVTVIYTDSIHPCDTALVEFTGSNQYNFAIGNSYTIKAYTSLPNGVNDNNHIDDTVTVGPVCVGLNGAYTINPAGSGVTNYTTFNSAVNALMCGGITGPVTFTVSDATYNEQVNIGNIPGIHDTARVTFIGTSQSGTILSYMASNANASHTLRINNSPYINIYNMTIQSAGASIGSAVHILGSSNYVKVKRCLIRASGAGASSTSQYLIPVLINSTSDITNPANGGTGVTNIEIDSNRIVAGYYSIYATGKSSAPTASRLFFRKNTIDSSYYYGANIQNYIDAVTFSNNEINMRITGPVNSYGFAIQNCYPLGTSTAGHTITNNKVINAGQYGMYIYQSYSSASFRSRLVNNMVGGGFRSNNSYGVQCSYLNYWDIFNNSVNLDFATNNSQYAAMHFQSGSQQDVRNNLVVYSATSGTGVPFYYSGAGFTALNYNNLYNYASANVLSIGGTTYDSVAFVGQGGFNANSRALLTPFANSRNLHLGASPLNKGVAIASVVTDIDGETRLSPPDVGADEYFSSMDIGVFTVDSPSAAAFCGANKNLVVKLKNYGNQTVVNANIDIVVNGVLFNTVAWTGNLVGGATSTQINLGSYNFSSGSYSLSISTSAPNGGTDVNANNDSAFKNVTITPSVTPAITLSASQTTLCSGVEVTFITQYTGGGTSPILQWRKNGLTIAFTGDTLKTTTLNDKDSFVVILTSSAACAIPQSVVSNHVKMNVGLTVAPDVTLSSTATTICAGTTVTFTAAPLNGGSAPTYTWYKNGVVTGGDSAKYVSATLQNGDSITVVLNSSLGCANPPKDTSAAIKMIVNPLLVPSASITASTVSFCAGTSVTFAATTVNPGTSPFYQWKRNGINVGVNNDTLIINNLNHNDSISLVLTSNATCATPAVVESNKIRVNVIALVVPTVTIANTTGTICTGSNASFTANPVNAGVNATYNWTVNSISAGTGKTFNSSALNHRDTVRLIITADTLCASPQQVTSSYVLMDVKQYVTPDVTITPLNPAMCAGGSASFTATPVNGGTTPSYQWIRNGVPVGTDSIRYLGTFNTADSVAVIITSNEMCLSRAKDTSAYAHVIITAPVTPSISIVATADSVCANGSLTFTATPVNGGTAPGYQWKKNGVNIGTNNAVQTFGSIINNDSFTVVLTSNAGCAVPTTATSNKLGITVIPNVVPSVTIAGSASSICAGGSVTFTATPVNGGPVPSYQWKKNGTNIGANDAVQIFSSINNNDNFTVVLTSNARCALPATATSAGKQITVTPNVTPSVSIGSSKTSICLGESVTFTATPVNGGTTPDYQWKINGTNAGTNSNVFTSTSISGTDTVSVELTSSITCVTAATVSSNKIKLNANAPVVPAVTVAASATAACNGTSIMFVATPSNGGTNPTFQWKINGSNASGQTNDTFTTSTLGNNDSVWVTMTSNALCASPASAASVKTGISISMPVTPSLSIVASVNTICRGEGVTYTATPTNGGTAPTYKWMQNGVEVGTNSPTFTTTTLQPEEDVTCLLTTNLTCVTSSTVLEFGPSVLVKIPPVKPVVTRTLNTLSTAVASQTYQWFKNDTSISGATARNFALVVNGQYSVKVDSNGCNTTSDKLAVTDMPQVGLNEVSTIGNIELYPNPAKSSAYLNVKFTTSAETEISIVDMYGKLVRIIPVGNVNSYTDMINMSEYADGVYFVLIKHGADMSQKRLVKAD